MNLKRDSVSQSAQGSVNPHPRGLTNRLRFGVAIVSVVGFIMGCSESKVAQCNSLIEVANQAAMEVEQVTQTASAEDTEAFRTVAAAADEAATTLESIELSDATLEEYKQRFITLYVETSAATQSLVDAVEQQNAQAATDAYNKLQSATQQESPLVDAVNDYCQSET
ncbi:MAG: hypothetical protein WBA57_21580 [Elainellaceae cyanobacterium]